LEISLPQSAVELKLLLMDLDQVLLKKALELARQWFKSILEQLDKAIAKHRGKGLSIEHVRGTWYQTCLGAVKVKRRQYRDKGGNYRYLLDEILGMDKRWHVTHRVQKLVSELATVMPYRRSAEVLSKASSIDIAHQTLWRIIARIADPHIEKAENDIKWLLDTGEIPEEGTKQLTRLFMEADGVMLSLQREKEKKAEVKLGIAYEGWEKVGKDRYKTVNKTAYAAIAGEQTFWAGMTLKLQGKYDLSRIRETLIGGDGASWVKDGVDYLKGRFQLDRYHLNRELTAALGRDTGSKSKVCQSIAQGDIQFGLATLAEAMKRASGEQAKRIAHAYGYLWDNRAGLIDYRLNLAEDEREGLRRTGAIEGNVDKLVVKRMKNQGMSWTIQGIRRLLCVRFLVRENKLTEWLDRGIRENPALPAPLKIVRRIVNRLSMHEQDEWLRVDMPALHGPHASRPWVRVLNSILEAQTF
jgi:Uncharacterised protein family (UPF0236)